LSTKQPSVIDRLYEALKDADPDDPDPVLSLIKTEETESEIDKEWLTVLKHLHKPESRYQNQREKRPHR
jgi:hypothetical protein